MGIYAVTGSASGIGRAVTEQLKAQGHEVIGVDLRDADITVDLSDPAQCQQAAARITERAQGSLDGLVPCAGVGPETARIELIPLINYFSTIDLVMALRPALAACHGAVVLISSNSAQMMTYDQDYVEALLADDRELAVTRIKALDGQTAYGGGKHALARWMRTNNAEFASSGIRMNAVAPGYTETAMTEAGRNDPVYGDAIREFVQSIPIGRPGLPEDQANAISFLLSEKASFISGSVLFVDGGHDAVFRNNSF
ncbi:SDR family oxidoreductase [Halieaceae bacterium IMCC14734]|uniref:SDR family oxidoreductase n=1 Tax=Candidatus Litorirhabdus singularis TaxID=2518993 RepID=A0ABT3TCE0_9GAMM|nr:SDR family oxidoreductase [Candidatus Litorirhabdus singularis]MCX2979654.1 SDR family oxidoreductase [Candidatus Litorirhabdus singularis]